MTILEGHTIIVDVYQVDDGVITAFKYDDRVFRSTVSVPEKKTETEVVEIIVKKDAEEPEKKHVGRPKKSYMETSEKTCSSCKKKKSLDDFNKNQYHCKECQHDDYVARLKKQKTEEKKTEQPVTIEPVKQKTLSWTKERDKIICENFGEHGVSGIYDKSMLPGFSLAEIRHRCQELGLLDEYGNRNEKNKTHDGEQRE